MSALLPLMRVLGQDDKRRLEPVAAIVKRTIAAIEAEG